jgi:polar amino acid transport system substrate-binding protein
MSRIVMTCALVFILSFAADGRAQNTLAPTGTLRALYLASNPAHAVRDSATGQPRGVAIDLARELGRRLGIPVTVTGAANPQAVIDAVQRGEADLGFVAYNPERAGPVEFSRPYMLVQQTFIVREGSSISSVAAIDRPGQRIGATKGDSIALYLARNLKQTQVVEIVESTPGEARQMVLEGKLDAFGANRQRLTDFIRGVSGLRLLPDDLYGVEQTLIVPKGKSEALTTLNQFIEDLRNSGFLRASIDKSGVIGITVAPK